MIHFMRLFYFQIDVLGNLNKIRLSVDQKKPKYIQLFEG